MVEFPGPADFAVKAETSRGRLHPERESTTRTPFQRDRDRIIHCAAFRRLKYKTQVFVYHEGDNYRTRLTHSLEVSQIARSVCRLLGLDEDLAEALALAHDLGHTPFGHAGGEALGKAMRKFGGYDHNAQTLRILTELEQRYADFDGLNLTWESLEGVVKHNGPLWKRGTEVPLKGPVDAGILRYNGGHDLGLDSYPSAEAQVAAIADDIAYNNHDIDDGLRAGLFTIDQIAEVTLAGPVIREVRTAYPELAQGRLIHETVRRLISRMVADVVAESRRRIAALAPRSADDIRAAERAVIAFSAEMAGHDRALKDFLHVHMYRHYKVNRMTSKARRIVTDLHELFLGEPQCLPSEWQERTDGAGSERTARVAADYIAGMTDRFAIEEYGRLFDVRTKQ